MEKGPERVGNIVGRLMTARGWGRRGERSRLEQAWATAIGESGSNQTRVGNLRRGVLEIIVANAVLLQELAHFRKRRLLEELRVLMPGTAVTDLRFRAGVIERRED
jgi:Dna[CI] antecedent, DciA